LAVQPIEVVRGGGEQGEVDQDLRDRVLPLDVRHGSLSRDPRRHLNVVVVRVDPQRVTRPHHPLDDRKGLAVDRSADQEERGVHIVSIQQVQNPRRDRRVRAVVERQHHVTGRPGILSVQSQGLIGVGRHLAPQGIRLQVDPLGYR
jgi:hypothetical protein